MVTVYAEGPTEWFTVYELYRRKILTHAVTLQGNDNNIGRWLINARSNVVSKLMKRPSQQNRILLVYDQERDDDPSFTAREIGGETIRFDESVGDHNSVFIGNMDHNTRVVLHVATAKSPDGNRDFDGYIVQIIERLGGMAVQELFRSDKIPGYVRQQYYKKNNIDYNQIHNLGLMEIPDMMKKKQWEILRSKGYIYSYVTALQINISHVIFTRKLVQYAPSEILEDVFAPLIAAWNLLAEETKR